MPTIKTKDGAQIYDKDWGQGQPVVFSHGWPLRRGKFTARHFQINGDLLAFFRS